MIEHRPGSSKWQAVDLQVHVRPWIGVQWSVRWEVDREVQVHVRL